MASVHRLLRGLTGVLVILLSGCSSVSEPTSISIAQLRDAFLDIEQGNSTWSGKRVTVSGGRVRRVWPNYVEVSGDNIRLWCSYEKANAAVVEKALREQAVTVTGRVGRQIWRDEPIIKLEACEFVLGSPPPVEGEAILASKGAEADAKRDIKARKLRLRFVHDSRSGSPPWFPRYQRLLKERCGVESDVKPAGAGPVIKGLWPADPAYNKVMIAEIEKRFGVGIVERLRKQAEGDTEK